MGIKATGTPSIIATPSNYDRLVESYVRIARENAELREENASLIKAVDNLDTANKKISNELSEVRWALIKAQEQIKKLTELDVDVEVRNHDTEWHCNNSRFRCNDTQCGQHYADTEETR